MFLVSHWHFNTGGSRCSLRLWMNLSTRTRNSERWVLPLLGHPHIQKLFSPLCFQGSNMWSFSSPFAGIRSPFFALRLLSRSFKIGAALISLVWSVFIDVIENKPVQGKHVANRHNGSCWRCGNNKQPLAQDISITLIWSAGRICYERPKDLDHCW